MVNEEVRGAIGGTGSGFSRLDDKGLNRYTGRSTATLYRVLNRRQNHEQMKANGIINTKTMPDNEKRLSKRFLPETANLSGILVGALILLVTGAMPALAAKDSVTVGSIPLAAAGDTVQVPVFVRDVSGTLLGGDAGSGRTIQDLSVLVQVSPTMAVTSVSFLKAGVLVGPTPVFEQLLSPGSQRGAVIAFSESGDPISFTLDSPLPGDLVGHLEVEIAAGFTQGVIDLDLVPAKTALGNQSGSLVERSADGRLNLVDGSITVDQGIFADGFESGNTSAWSNTVP